MAVFDIPIDLLHIRASEAEFPLLDNNEFLILIVCVFLLSVLEGKFRFHSLLIKTAHC